MRGMIRRALPLALLVSGLIIVLSIAAEHDSVDQSALKEQLVKLEKQSWEAWKNRDGKFFEGFLSDDHVEVGFSGVASKKEVVQVVGSPVCNVKSYELDHFEMKLLDQSTALLTYREAQ